MLKGIKYTVLDEPTRIFLSELKSLRESIGMLQRELTLVLNIPRGTYSKYETAIVSPSMENLMKLVEYFGYDLSDSLNYKYFHGEIDPSTIKRKLKKYGLSYHELQRLTGIHYTRIYRSVNLKHNGSLVILSSVLEVLHQEEESERFRKELLSKRRPKTCRKN